MLIKNSGKCSPQAQDNFSKWNTCLSLNDLRTIAALYNQHHTDRSTQIPASAFKSAESLIHELDRRFMSRCGPKNETCWLEQGIVRSNNIYHELCNRFRPKMKDSWKANPKQWLDTFDILQVMNQYEVAHPSFKFLGVFPADVMAQNVCSLNNMCNFSLKKLLEQGKKSMGVVFNLDVHDQSGSHWVAVYADFDKASPKFGVYYYDSFGRPPPKKLKDFTLTLKKQAGQIFTPKELKKFIGRYNTLQHQFQNTECGMYSMIFIIMCLEQKNADYYRIRDSIPPRSDDLINKMRAQLFS